MYLPRTPPFSLDRSYSRRSSSRRSRFSAFFFIMFSFALRRPTRADNPDVLVAVYMGDDQNLAGARHSNRDKTLFRCRMIRVGIRYGQRITKYSWRVART